MQSYSQLPGEFVQTPGNPPQRRGSPPANIRRLGVDWGSSLRNPVGNGSPSPGDGLPQYPAFDSANSTEPSANVRRSLTMIERMSSMEDHQTRLAQQNADILGALNDIVSRIESLPLAQKQREAVISRPHSRRSPVPQLARPNTPPSPTGSNSYIPPRPASRAQSVATVATESGDSDAGARIFQQTTLKELRSFSGESSIINLQNFLDKVDLVVKHRMIPAHIDVDFIATKFNSNA